VVFGFEGGRWVSGVWQVWVVLDLVVKVVLGLCFCGVGMGGMVGSLSCFVIEN